ncbi:E3 ubiquitin-protein ligase Topors-like [Equus asinus]|uniref:RING-type E3 ubiquitin transferase n=1 Tax=Equus asinus TaxID=9793 RepID=A0A8C4MXI5_EQUAS|nr:E3 ubiquitin-protein ligase Topors-like [Equus asinus]XP_044635539.1 E3 ubiquitin-protein ligase Topors-like [Equus asinus]
MPLDLSSDCECPNCLEGTQNESNWNPCSNKSGNDSLYSRPRKKSMSASSMQCFTSQCCSTRPENNIGEDSVFPPSEEESYVESFQNNHLSLNREDIARKIRPLRELTVQELLNEFGDSGKFPPNSMSVGHFRDHVVMKFRRALYYSGIWVTHVQGYRLEKHLSANYFKRNPGRLHRLVPWLKRELTAVYGDYGYTVKNILAAILHHMTECDLDSELFVHLLEPYLQQHTHHFLHEFISFVHSPYNMETYDQRAIYQCPSASPRVKKMSMASVPSSPLPKDQALLASQHDTKQPKKHQGQCSNEQRPLSGLKHFPNGNSTLKTSEIPLHTHKTASKIHAWIKDKPESGDHKGTISTDNLLLNWVTPRESSPGLLNCKKNVQEKKTDGTRLLPGRVQGLGKRETTARTFSSPAIFNQGQPEKHSLRERRGLRVGQQINFQKKEAEENKYSSSSPKIFQRRLSRERSLISCKSRKRDPSYSCTSETAFSSKRDGRKLGSFRKKRTKCRQSSQFAEAGSHYSRSIQRRSRFSTHRSKSWCVGFTKGTVSRESSNLSLKGSLKSEYLAHNICCEPSKEKNVHGYESNNGRASSTQYVKLLSTAGKRPSKREVASQAGSHCDNLTCLQTEEHKSPGKQEMKQKATFPTARKARGDRHRKNKCQCPDVQTTEDVSDEVGDLNGLRQMSSLSECAPSCRGQIQKKKQNSSLQKHHQAKNEHKRDKISETQRCKLF